MADATAVADKAPAPQVDPDVRKAVEAARGVLVAHGLSDIAARAWSQVTKPAGVPNVVVIGEIKRGKSSLVNALLGRANVSPVDVDIATSAFVRFVRPSESRAEGDTDLLFAGGRRHTIDFADLADWVTVQGRHVNDPNIDELPIGAEVAMGSRFLPRVTLVDTPGVGGLNPNHLRLTKTATTSADVLVMTCDASVPITAPELSFLEAISADVNSVMIAVTKTDKNLLHWRSIVEENRRLLGKHAPRFADVAIVGLSCPAALAAARMEPGDRRDAALAASGLTEMVTKLQAICAAGDQLSAANGLRAARSGLQRIANELELQRAAIAGGQKAVADLTEEKNRMQALREEWEGGWRDFLARDLAAVQRDTLRSLDHKLDELKAQWRTKLEKTQTKILRRSPQMFVADMTADLEVLIGEVSDGYIKGVTEVVGKLKIDAEISLDALSSEVRQVERVRKRGEGVLDPSMLSVLTSGISTIGIGLASLLGGIVAIPVGVAAAGTWIAVNYGFRAIKMGRQALQQWLNMTVGAVAKDVSREIQDRGESIRPQILNEYKKHLVESMNEIKALLTAAEAAAKASKAERADGIAEIDTKRKSLQTTIAAVETQLVKLTADAKPAELKK